NLMSYVIYEGKSELVPLSDEIKHIQDYLDLEKLRYGDRLQSSIEVSGVIDNRYIPPLILLPFIENSFKHGNTYSDPFPINIEIAVNNKSLKYIVRNELCLNEENLKNKEVQEGIGLKNTIRQLDLLFNSQYNLEIKEDSTTFNVILSIPVYDKMSDS
ncbi:MAG: histidine kinase, partial [Bacteroidota bacterium]